MLAIFLDTETNGLNYRTHKVIEIAFQMIDVLSGDVKVSYTATLQLTKEDWEKSDPESLKVNGFTWDDVKQGKPASLVSREIIDLFTKWKVVKKEAVFICQNPSFDRVFFGELIAPEVQDQLNWPYHWLDLASMHWAMMIRGSQEGKGPMPWEVGLSKDRIAAFYDLPREEKPHRAMQGVKHLVLCYQRVIGFPGKAKLGN